MSVLRFITLMLVLVTHFPVFGQEKEQDETGRQTDRFPPILEVTLQDGRVLTGNVGPQTTDSRLSLVLFTHRAQVKVDVAFSQVREVRAAGQSLTLDSLQQNLDEFRLQRVPDLARPEITEDPASPPRTRPQAISIHAELANWDADSEPDGLLLYLRIEDGDGQSLILPGHLESRLVALRPYHWRDAAHPDLAPRVTELKSWGVRVRSTDFRDGVAVVKLPFHGVSPEEMTDLAPLALISARYSIAGTGVFEASDTDVPIRRMGWTRDDLQLLTGRRKLSDDE